MKVKIMIDSASDVSEVEAKQLGLEFVPIQVRVEDEEYFDGVDLLPKEFYEKLVASKEMPQTSLINEYRWDEAFASATKDGSELVVIALSSKLSGTYQSALEASKKYNGKVHVVDSMNAALGERLLGLYALQLANSGMDAKDIAKELNAKKSKVCVYAVIDTLKYLKKGGRISATTAFVGEMLSIKPVIGVIEGEVKVIGKARGNKKGNLLLNSIIEENGGINFDMPYGLIYSGNDKTNIEKYKEDSINIFAGNKPDAYCLGCTIGTHIGPGAVGVAFFKN